MGSAITTRLRHIRFDASDVVRVGQPDHFKENI